jgi:hypothetical protein
MKAKLKPILQDLPNTACRGRGGRGSGRPRRWQGELRPVMEIGLGRSWLEVYLGVWNRAISFLSGRVGDGHAGGGDGLSDDPGVHPG